MAYIPSAGATASMVRAAMKDRANSPAALRVFRSAPEYLGDGVYLVKQRSATKSVDHYGILDVGDRLALGRPWRAEPVVIHQTPPSIQVSCLRNTGSWQVLGRIANERAARERMRAATQNSRYDLLGRNCEHFARFIATGVKRSTQIETAAIIATIALLALTLR
jgi:hypothetical protein